MFDIRKIQEQVIYGAIKSVSNDEAAKEIVYGKDEIARTEDNPTWVKSTMKRLENNFQNIYNKRGKLWQKWQIIIKSLQI